MPTYVIYSTATAAVQWLAIQPSVPKPGAANLAVLQVPDGTMLGSSRWEVLNGQLVPHVATLAEARQAKTAAAQAFHDGLFTAPNGFTYLGALMPIDPASRADMQGQTLSAILSVTNATAYPWPSGFTWAAESGAPVAMTAAQMVAFGRKIAEYTRLCRAHLHTITAAIAAAATQPAIDAIDVTAGYPAASG